MIILFATDENQMHTYEKQRDAAMSVFRILIGIALSLLAGCAMHQEITVASPATDNASVDADCMVFAVPNMTEFAVGDRIKIDLILANVGAAPCTSAVTETEIELGMWVTGPDGRSLPYSILALQRMASAQKNATRELAPGKSESEEFHISDDFDFSTPGGYTINLSRKYWATPSDIARTAFTWVRIIVKQRPNESKGMGGSGD